MKRKRKAEDGAPNKKIVKYEKLLVGSPQSSLIWVHYATHFINSGETQRARLILRRALERMNLDNEKERLNIWKTILLVEHLYGSEQGLRKVLTEALKVNEPKSLYRQTINLYQEQKNWKEMEKMHKGLVKEYRTDQTCWIDYYSFVLTTQGFSDSKRTSQLKNVEYQALEAMNTKAGVGFKARIGKVLFSENRFDEARLRFEVLLQKRPKRFDIAMMYIDLEMKYSAENVVIRRLFDRLIQLPYSRKQTQTIFKKYLLFEQKQPEGDTNKVKDKARAYLDNS